MPAVVLSCRKDCTFLISGVFDDLPSMNRADNLSKLPESNKKLRFMNYSITRVEYAGAVK